MPEREYKRLTRARRRPGFAAVVSSHSSLWLGNDHLLCIDTNGYSESYKRFYFRDIQAFVMRKTTRGVIWSILFGSFTAFCCILASIATEGVDVFFWVMAALFGFVLAINLLLGPTCAFHLQTAVQTELVPSLSRIRRVRKVLNRIRPLIEATQGAVSPEEIPARMRGLFTAETPPGQTIS